MTTDAFSRAIKHFNVEAYRDALLAFEELWVVERSDFLKALIQLCNALNQLRLGLVTGPRSNLASAERLLAPYEPCHAGLDVAALRAYIADVRSHIPADLESGAGMLAWDRVPRLRLAIMECTERE